MATVLPYRSMSCGRTFTVFPKHCSEVNCFALFPNGLAFSGLSISASLMVTAFAPFMTSMVSPSFTATTLVDQASKATVGEVADKERRPSSSTKANDIRARGFLFEVLIGLEK